MVQKPVPTLVLRSVRLVAAIGGLALATTGEIDFFVLAVFIGLFFLGLKIERLPRLSKMATVFQPVMAVIVFAIAVVDFFYLSQSFLLTVAIFLLMLQSLRLLALGTLRENVGSVLLSSLMILSASTLAVEWTFFVILFCFLPAVIWTVILINLSFEGQAELVERSLAWRHLLPSLRASTMMAFGVTVLCCAIVFIGFPRFSFRGFKGQFLQPVHKTGFTTNVNLSKTGRIYTDNAIVMRVKINPEDRSDWNGYLRGATLDSFDGREWKRSPWKSKRIVRSFFGDVRLASRIDAVGRRIHQTIYLESVDTPVLFAAPWPVAMKIDQPFVDIFEDLSLQRRPGDSWRLHYEVDSYPSLRTSDTLPHDMRRALLMPGLVPQENTLTLLRSVVGGVREPRKKAERLEAYLKNNFRYSLFNDAADKTSPLEQFLFETKQGHCEYFASAMCVMLRLSGVPARMVSGFVAHEWNEQGNYYVVRMWDAHAWVEAYFEPRGWVQFDPTPRQFSTHQRPGWASRLSNAMDYLNLQWNRYILSYDLERQVNFVKGLSISRHEIRLRGGRWFKWKGLSWKRPSTAAAEKQPGNFLPVFLVVGSAVLLCGVWFVLKKRRSERVWFYRALVRAMEKIGGPKPSQQTVGEFLEKISADKGETHQSLVYLTEAYYRLRFDPAARFTKEDHQTVRDILKSL